MDSKNIALSRHARATFLVLIPILLMAVPFISVSGTASKLYTSNGDFYHSICIASLLTLVTIVASGFFISLLSAIHRSSFNWKVFASIVFSGGLAVVALSISLFTEAMNQVENTREVNDSFFSDHSRVERLQASIAEIDIKKESILKNQDIQERLIKSSANVLDPDTKKVLTTISDAMSQRVIPDLDPTYANTLHNISKISSDTATEQLNLSSDTKAQLKALDIDKANKEREITLREEQMANVKDGYLYYCNKYHIPFEAPPFFIFLLIEIAGVWAGYLSMTETIRPIKKSELEEDEEDFVGGPSPSPMSLGFSGPVEEPQSEPPKKKSIFNFKRKKKKKNYSELDRIFEPELGDVESKFSSILEDQLGSSNKSGFRTGK